MVRLTSVLFPGYKRTIFLYHICNIQEVYLYSISGLWICSVHKHITLFALSTFYVVFNIIFISSVAYNTAFYSVCVDTVQYTMIDFCTWRLWCLKLLLQSTWKYLADFCWFMFWWHFSSFVMCFCKWHVYEFHTFSHNPQNCFWHNFW